MSKKTDNNGTSLFGVIGFIIGLVLGYDLSESWIFALIAGGVMAYVGAVVEIILVKVLAFFIAILILLIRHEILSALFDNI